MQLREGDRVFRLEQLRYRSGNLVAFDRVTLPQDLLPGFDLERLSSATLSEIAREVGLPLGKVIENVDRVRAPADVAALLEIPEANVLQLDRVTFTASGRPIEWRVTYSSL